MRGVGLVARGAEVGETKTKVGASTRTRTRSKDNLTARGSCLTQIYLLLSPRGEMFLLTTNSQVVVVN